MVVVRWLLSAGMDRIPAGRMGEGPALGLAKTLEDANFKLMRLKTGKFELSCLEPSCCTLPFS